jgi:DNA repair protein RecN (Recombination protein N)
MLTDLRIENLALMESASLSFSPGFTALTGETGAGKSILLGALALLSGARAEKTLIRQGADTCSLEAVLHLPRAAEINAFMESNGLPTCEEGVLILRRLLHREKPGRIYLNGAPGTQAQLRALGAFWIDFHGPGEPQKLFHESEQLALLDLFANAGGDLGTYREAYRAWRACGKEIEDLLQTAKLSPEEAAFLKAQIAEIDQLKLSHDRIDELEQDYRRVRGAHELRELCADLDERFLGSKGICGQLQACLPKARELAESDPSADHLADRVESLLIEANDLSGEWRSLAMEADFDADQIRRIEEDMDAWQTVRRRFGGSVETVLAKRGEMAQRLALQGDLEGTSARLEAKAAKLKEEATLVADRLRSLRLQAAQKLSRAAEGHLRRLGFKKPRLDISLNRLPELGPNGDCSCCMTFAPNPGSAPLPLNKIASSGEMARVMLALKSVLASVDATPVLVFDEVDANIGGEVATSVARLLEELGNNHQVFCITHLAQVASVAKNHYVVEKEQGEETTEITIRELGKGSDARMDEVARMLGDRSSASALQHAAALLKEGGKQP